MQNTRYTYMRKHQLGSMFNPCSHGQLQRVDAHHWSWSWLSVFWRVFFLLNFFPCVSLLWFCFQLSLPRMSWFVHVLSVVRAIMFNWGILFYSKWPFGQSQHTSKKSNLSHWWTVYLWVEWSRSENASGKFSVECEGLPGVHAEELQRRKAGKMSKRSPEKPTRHRSLPHILWSTDHTDILFRGGNTRTLASDTWWVVFK